MTRMQWIAHLTFVPAFVGVHFVDTPVVHILGSDLDIMRLLFYGVGGAIAKYWIMDRVKASGKLSLPWHHTPMSFDKPEG